MAKINWLEVALGVGIGVIGVESVVGVPIGALVVMNGLGVRL